MTTQSLMSGAREPKKFAQVSLPAEFHASVREAAESSDRSMAAQLEHWAKLARAVEAVFPATSLAELKAMVSPTEVLAHLAEVVLAQQPVALRAALANSRSPRYGVDETDPNVAVRIEPDGTRTRGRFEGTEFVALEGTHHAVQTVKAPRRAYRERNQHTHAASGDPQRAAAGQPARPAVLRRA